MNDYHIPVLLKEVICSLNIKKNGKYIDATLGGGGHTEAILEAGGRVLAIDVDTGAIDNAKERLSSFYNIACPSPQNANWQMRTSISQTGALSPNIAEQRLILVHDNFSNLKEICQQNNFNFINGILFDLGVSTHQLVTPERGFSFNTNAILDMRMDKNLSVKALDLVNGLNEGELYELFKKLGEEHHSRRVAHALILARQIKPIVTCDRLAEIILSVVPRRGKFDRTHPATRIFQALRIAVNDELNNLKQTLPQTLGALDSGGRIAIISFHSLEDRIVKNFFLENQKERILKIITKHPIVPADNEIKKNPRSRSAKLRIAEKI